MVNECADKEVVSLGMHSQCGRLERKKQITDAEGNTIIETKAVNDVWFKFKIQRKAA